MATSFNDTLQSPSSSESLTLKRYSYPLDPLIQFLSFTKAKKEFSSFLSLSGEQYIIHILLYIIYVEKAAWDEKLTHTLVY